MVYLEREGLRSSSGLYVCCSSLSENASEVVFRKTALVAVQTQKYELLNTPEGPNCSNVLGEKALEVVLV